MINTQELSSGDLILSIVDDDICLFVSISNETRYGVLNFFDIKCNKLRKLQLLRPNIVQSFDKLK